MTVSRPWVQRNELGPLVHQLGHEIYDQAEVEILGEVDAGRLKAPTHYGQLESLVGRLADTLYGLTPNDETLESMLYTYNPIIKNNDLATGSRLTHYFSPVQILDEGLRTGIVAPLLLYRAATIPPERIADIFASIMHQQYRGTELPFDVERAVVNLKSPYFQKMLHFLALGANGSLGRASSAVDDLIYFSEDLGPLKIYPPDSRGSRFGATWATKFAAVVEGVAQQRREQFIYDKQGNPVDFTPNFKREFMEEQQSIKSGWSGGCPVRHETYKITGPLAAEYFKAQGQAEGLPARQGESLITRGNRFIATILAATVAVEQCQ